MSRDALLRADTDTGKMSDPKVLALARRLLDPVLTSAALTLHEAVLLASWRDGERLALPDCLPAWWIAPPEILEQLVAALIAVRLLDDEQRIPEHAFESWYSPVLERLMILDRKSIFGGLRRQGLTIDQANREADQRIRARPRWQPKAEPKAGQPKGQPPALLPARQPASQPGAEQDERGAGRPVGPTDRPAVSAGEQLLGAGLDPAIANGHAGPRGAGERLIDGTTQATARRKAEAIETIRRGGIDERTVAALRTNHSISDEELVVAPDPDHPEAAEA
jgi:hypothetical protein